MWWVDFHYRFKLLERMPKRFFDLSSFYLLEIEQPKTTKQCWWSTSDTYIFKGSAVICIYLGAIFCHRRKQAKAKANYNYQSMRAQEQEQEATPLLALALACHHRQQIQVLKYVNVNKPNNRFLGLLTFTYFNIMKVTRARWLSCTLASHESSKHYESTATIRWQWQSSLTSY